MSEIVLQFDDVKSSSDSEHVGSIEAVSCQLAAGEVLLVKVDSDSEQAPIIDLALGLIEPDGGRVLFNGKSWTEMDAFESSANRGRIGSVFEKGGWISSLTVSQNVLLRVRHHTHLNEKLILDEAEALSKDAGLPGLSNNRPEMVRDRHLRIYEWVRACVGEPDLILLSFPERGAPSYSLPRLLDMVERVAERGAAVLWMTDSDLVCNSDQLQNAKHSVIEKERWCSHRERTENET